MVQVQEFCLAYSKHMMGMIYFAVYCVLMLTSLAHSLSSYQMIPAVSITRAICFWCDKHRQAAREAQLKLVVLIGQICWHILTPLSSFFTALVFKILFCFFVHFKIMYLFILIIQRL